MKNFAKKEVGIIVVLLVMAFLISSCVHGMGQRGSMPPLDKKVAFELEFNKEGRLNFNNPKGENVTWLPFKEHIERKKESDKPWKIEKITTITIYHVTGSHEVWFDQDGESACYLFDNNWNYIGNCV